MKAGNVYSRRNILAPSDVLSKPNFIHVAVVISAIFEVAAMHANVVERTFGGNRHSTDRCRHWKQFPFVIPVLESGVEVLQSLGYLLFVSKSATIKNTYIMFYVVR